MNAVRVIRAAFLFLLSPVSCFLVPRKLVFLEAHQANRRRLCLRSMGAVTEIPRRKEELREISSE